MKGMFRSALVVGLVLLPGAAGAQMRLVAGIGGGPTFPVKSGFNDQANTPTDINSLGYHLQAMLGFQPAGRVGFRVDAQYGTIKYEEGVSGARPRHKIFAVNADLVFHPSRQDAGVRPYLLAGPGYYSFQFDDGQTGDINDADFNNVGVNGGAGLNLGRSDKVYFFIESRYIWTEDHRIIPVTVGIRINLSQPSTRR
ncbi:MAG: outer membrane beta-barrel protein [Gemmatimonadales bacterium]